MDKLSGKNNMVPKLSRLSKAFFVAIGCGCGTSLVCIYLYNKMQVKIRETDFYKDGINVLFRHEQASKQLGIPVSLSTIDYPSSSKYLYNNICKLKIPVIGPDDKGHVYLKGVHVGAESYENCKLTQVDLHLNFARKKYVLYEDKDLTKS